MVIVFEREEDITENVRMVSVFAHR